MAWYSLYKWFAPWRKTEYIDMIYYYSEYVLKTEEQRIAEKESRRRKARQLMAVLGVMSEISTTRKD